VEGVYLTWMMSALALGVLLLPVYAPPWAKLTLSGFVDFIRRYWVHVLLLLIIYNAKDSLDQIDRILMASAGFDMTPWIYAIEGDLVLRVQETFESAWLTSLLTHFYVAGFMFICYVSVFYVAYFDDRWMADRIVLSIAWVYVLAVPFYLFFNVRVTGDVIPGMETLAYDLNPEISDWFRRIDPFTNGMPSLHIGIPAVVFLTLLRWDEDGRWRRYRHTVLGYILLTAFTIVYLGIHWLSDILGGLLVASLAVALTERSVNFVWRIGDERTMNARLASLLTRPRIALAALAAPLVDLARRYRRPEARETGLALIGVLVVVFLVVTFDLTHQALPAGGTVAPEGATAADGWLASLDNQSGTHVMLLYDLTLPDEPFLVDQPLMREGDPFALDHGLLVMANSTRLMAVEATSEAPLVLDLPLVARPTAVAVAEGRVVLTVVEGVLEAWSPTGEPVALPEEATNVTVLATSGGELAWSTSNAPGVVRIARLQTTGSVGIVLNASAPVEQEQAMMEWGLPVDLVNRTVIDLDLSPTHLAAVVNVSTVDRLVLYERATATSVLIGDGKYSAADPDLGVHLMAFTAWDHLDPRSPENKYLDGEIHLHNLTTNRTEVLTADLRHQWSPTVLDHHIIYLEEAIDGSTSVEIHSRHVELQPYANIVLQTGLVVALLLTVANVVQRQRAIRSTATEEE
jgi:membrane-associated phospholipid phosphatase